MSRDTKHTCPMRNRSRLWKMVALCAVSWYCRWSHPLQTVKIAPNLTLAQRARIWLMVTDTVDPSPTCKSRTLVGYSRDAVTAISRQFEAFRAAPKPLPTATAAPKG